MISQPGLSASPSADLAVVIPHFDDLVRLRRCLAALSEQDRRGVEIVVADNATPGGLGRLPDDFPGCRFVDEPRKGAAAARNAGVAASSAPWIAFLDADCVPDRDWLGRAMAVAAGPPDVITGGRVAVFDETPPPRSGAEVFETVFAFDQQDYITRKGFSVTANVVVSREAFLKVGPFAPGVAEDIEWCARATGAGFRLAYDDALVVSHPTRSDWRALRQKWRRLVEEGFAMQDRGGRARMAWAVKAMAIPLSTLWFLPRVWRHPGLSLPERLSGSATLVRLRAARMAWMFAQVLSTHGK